MITRARNCGFQHSRGKLPRMIGFRNYEVFAEQATRDTIVWRGRAVPVGWHAMSDFALAYEA